jgi:hypothetical protein
MGNAPAHPPSLQDYVLPEFSIITVKFLPPNMTPLIQPMDQQVISNFKKLYTKALFQRCFEVTSDTELTLRVFWNDHFTIVHSITLIDKAWQEAGGGGDVGATHSKSSTSKLQSRSHQLLSNGAKQHTGESTNAARTATTVQMETTMGL